MINLIKNYAITTSSSLEFIFKMASGSEMENWTENENTREKSEI